MGDIKKLGGLMANENHAENKNQPEPNEKLVTIFDGEQETEAWVVHGVLQSAGIESIVRSRDAQQEVFPVGGVMVLVREEEADEARQIIEEYRQDAAKDPEFSEEPPASV
jgi:hypothetical protein